MPSSTVQPKFRLEILDALRGVAALAVALFHMNLWGANPLGTICSYGYLGVEVFFVISGFIIPYSLARSHYVARNDYGRFMLKRMVRLYPPYLASVVLVIVLWHLSALTPGFRGALTYTPGQAALHATLLNDIVGVRWVNPVYWSLAIELQFYLLAGSITPLMLAGRRCRWAVLGTLLVVSLVPISTVRPNNAWILQYLPLFVLGILAFLHDQTKISTRNLLLGSVVAIGCGVWSLSWPQMLAGGIASMAIVFVRLPMPKLFLWLGGISYSFYLLHVPLGGRVLNLAPRFLSMDTFAEKALTVAVALTISLVASWLWFRLLEAPSQRWSSAIRYIRPGKDS